jgi:hypothetical protein
MTNPVGRPRLPPGTKKVQIAAKVAPATAAYLHGERARTGKPLAILIEEATALHQAQAQDPTT